MRNRKRGVCFEKKTNSVFGIIVNNGRYAAISVESSVSVSLSIFFHQKKNLVLFKTEILNSFFVRIKRNLNNLRRTAPLINSSNTRYFLF